MRPFWGLTFVDPLCSLAGRRFLLFRSSQFWMKRKFFNKPANSLVFGVSGTILSNTMKLFLDTFWDNTLLLANCLTFLFTFLRTFLLSFGLTLYPLFYTLFSLIFRLRSMHIFGFSFFSLYTYRCFQRCVEI